MSDTHVEPQKMIQALDHFARMLNGAVEGISAQSPSEQLWRAAHEVQNLAEELALGSSQPTRIDEILQQAFRWIDEGNQLNPGTAERPVFPHMDISKISVQATNRDAFPVGQLSLVACENGGDELVLDRIIQTAMDEKRPVLLFTEAVSEHSWISEAYVGLRLCGAASLIPFRHLESSMLDSAEWEKLNIAMRELAECVLSVEIANGLTVPEIVFKSRRATRMAGGQTGLIVIEQSQRISGLCADDFRMPEWMGLMKSLAREMRVPILMVYPTLAGNDFDTLAKEADTVLRL